MASTAARETMAELRANRKPPRPVVQERAEWEAEAAAAPLPEGTAIAPATLGGIASEWITNGAVGETGLVLMLHGGGYRAGSPITHRGFAGRVSRLTGLRVLVPDYRLAPEHPYPAGPDDALAVYTALVESGTKPGEIVLFGDSAGGGLAITLMLKLKQAGLPQPAGAVLMSPWTDLECSGASYAANAATDPTTVREDLLSAADDYRGSLPANDPMMSPIHADLAGLPKMLVQAGGGEIMLDDAAVFVERAQAAGCLATLDVTADVGHVFQAWPDSVPEVQAAFEMVGDFVAGLDLAAGSA